MNASISALTALYNTRAPKPITKFKDKATAEARVTALAEELGLVVIDDADGVRFVEPAKSTGEAPKPRGRKSPLLNRRLKLLWEENPKRPGTRTHDRYELYRTVSTSSEYMDACRSAGLGTRREILSDLAWDSSQEFIKLYVH